MRGHRTVGSNQDEELPAAATAVVVWYVQKTLGTESVPHCTKTFALLSETTSISASLLL